MDTYRVAKIATLLAWALVVLAYGQPPQQTPSSEMGFICATAGELGVAGEPPNLAFSVFEKAFGGRPTPSSSRRTSRSS
ncbi:MAG: hypothetical protein QW434_00935 [Pyrobaculum sp.]